MPAPARLETSDMIWRPIRLALLAIFVLCTSASPAPHSAAAGADQRLGAAIDAYARPLIEARSA